MHDVAVIGGGGMGSAITYHCAKRGMNTVCFEQFELVHKLGSSHGESRIIRQAYFEDPEYVPFLLRAYELWRDLEKRSGKSLLYTPGIVMNLKKTDSQILAGVQASSEKYGIHVDVYSPGQAERKFPGFIFQDGFEVLFEPTGGYLRVEDCVQTFLEQAVREGARVYEKCPVDRVEQLSDGWRIYTATGAHDAKKIVYAAGAWNRDLLKPFGVELTVHLVQSAWFKSDQKELEKYPVWITETGSGMQYGFPSIGERGIKTACHLYEMEAQDSLQTLDRTNNQSQIEDLHRGLNGFILGNHTLTDAATCLYTMTKDENFILDRHPELDNVFVVAGMSGHGFKFASVIGEYMSQMVENGRTKLDGSFLKLRKAVMANS